MAVIRAYRGLRYRKSLGSLDSMIAPPHDAMSLDERADYASRSPFNVVHLTFPEAKQDDRSKYIKYARSAATLSEWRREGVFELEKHPAFYRYTQEFSLEDGGPRLKRTALLTLLKLEPLSTGMVISQKQVLPKLKEDRLRILEATRAHLESIVGLYEDPGGQIHKAISDAPVGDTVSADSGNGIFQELAPIVDETAIAILSKLFSDKKIWIADGLHLYETALAFRQSLGNKSSEIAEDYIPIAITSMSDPGLSLLPTARAESLTHSLDRNEAIALATQGASSSWLRNPTTLDDMKTIALDGERTPPKSTYYFPKMQSGMVLWTLDSF